MFECLILHLQQLAGAQQHTSAHTHNVTTGWRQPSPTAAVVAVDLLLLGLSTHQSTPSELK